MARLQYEAYPRAVDANGDPESGAKLYVYQAGTTTPVTTYSDSGLTSAQAHPVVADSNGIFAQIYLPDDATYKVVLTDASDVTLQTIDNIQQNFLGSTGGLLGIQESSPQYPLVVGRQGDDTSHSGLQSNTTIVAHPGSDLSTNTGDGSALTILGGNTSTGGVYFADPEDNDVGGFTYNHSTNEATGRAGGANTLVITSTGIKIAGGSDELNTYQEGTFTPVVADALSGGNEATTSAASGQYVRIGRDVKITLNIQDIDTTGLTGSNDIFITGLPFTSRNSTEVRYLAPAGVSNFTFTEAPLAYIAPNVDYVRLALNNSGAALSFYNVSALTSGTADIFFGMSYTV